MGFFLPFLAGLVIGNAGKSCECDHAARAARNAEWSRRFDERQRRYATREMEREREKRERRIDFLAKYAERMKSDPVALADEIASRHEAGTSAYFLREHYPEFAAHLDAAGYRRRVTDLRKSIATCEKLLYGDSRDYWRKSERREMLRDLDKDRAELSELEKKTTA